MSTSIALETIRVLGAVKCLYVPRIGAPRQIDVLIDPMRRTDDLGNSVVLTKTFELYFVKGSPEGVDDVDVNHDMVGIYLHTTDMLRTMLKITKLIPEWDEGIPGDGVGMWHVEAVQ